MKKPIKRREFLIQGTLGGMACCVMLAGAKGFAYGNSRRSNAIERIDPKLLNYCGYKCPADCKFLIASEKDDAVLKKEVYQNWKIREKYNVDFDPEKIFCFGCKNKEKAIGIVVERCQVRQCVMEKGFDCCIECNELTGCQKELWTQYPEFKKQVMDMQKKYFAEKAG